MSDYNINGWDAVIEACTILKKYGSEKATSPFHCEHDILYVCDGIDPDDVSDEDKARLDELGFIVSTESGEPGFISFRFGSA